jgi:hypothetical protein
MLMLFQFLLVTVLMVANAQTDKGGSEDTVVVDYF